MDGLRTHLTDSRLAGDVATSPGATLANCRKLAAGDPDYTFGLGTDVTDEEAAEAVAALCGREAVTRPADGPGWIDPDATLAAIAVHRDRLAAVDGGRVLLATGHPTGLLAHYGSIARVLAGRGCEVLGPLDDEVVRYLYGVACAWRGGDLLHTHRSGPMEAMLAALDAPPDLVVADHGFAGAAIAAGIPTLSIADVNDPALAVAQARGLTDAVLPVDDNLAPRLFVRVTEAVLGA